MEATSARALGPSRRGAGLDFPSTKAAGAGELENLALQAAPASRPLRPGRGRGRLLRAVPAGGQQRAAAPASGPRVRGLGRVPGLRPATPTPLTWLSPSSPPQRPRPQTSWRCWALPARCTWHPFSSFLQPERRACTSPSVWRRSLQVRDSTKVMLQNQGWNSVP